MRARISRSSRSFSARDPLAGTAGTCSRDDTSSSASSPHERDSRGRVIPRATPLPTVGVDAPPSCERIRGNVAMTFASVLPSSEFIYSVLFPPDDRALEERRITDVHGQRIMITNNRTNTQHRKAARGIHRAPSERRAPLMGPSSGE